MKKKLNLDELKVKSFVTAEDKKIKETVLGGGGWSYPCNYYTKEKFCGDTGFRECNKTEVAICGHETENFQICTSVSGHGGGWG